MRFNYAFIRIVGGFISVIIENNNILLPQIYIDDGDTTHSKLFNMISKDAIEKIILVENSKCFYYVILKKNIRINPKCKFMSISSLNNNNLKLSEICALGIEFYINSLSDKFKESKEIIRFLLSNNIYFYKNNAKEVFLIINSLSYYEQDNKNQRPDIICDYKKEDICIGIEMFDFDSTKRKRGSMIGFEKRRELDEKYNKFMENASSGQVIEVNMDQKSNLANYLSNFSYVFSKHIENIKDYESKLESINSNHKLGFFVNDKTIGGLFKRIGKKLALPYIFEFKDFWDLFIKEEKLDFIIFTSYNSKSYYFIFRDDYEYIVKDGLLSNSSNEFICINSPMYFGKI